MVSITRLSVYIAHNCLIFASLDRHSSLEALTSALDNLDTLFDIIGKKYVTSLKEDDYEKWNEES